MEQHQGDFHIYKEEERTDTTAAIRISSPNVGIQGFPFTLYPADGKKFISYHTRPFAARAVQTADEMKIPSCCTVRYGRNRERLSSVSVVKTR